MKKTFVVLLVFSSLLFSQWEPITVVPFNGRIAGFYMNDSLNITAALEGDSCSVIKSSDGGRNWVIKNRIPLSYIDLIDFFSDSVMFVSGGSPLLNLKSTNGGTTWINIVIPPIYLNLTKFQFIDANNAYALARLGSTTIRLIKTTDGGVSWSNLDSTRINISSFRFIDKYEGWLFGTRLLYTTDGGNTFANVTLPNNFYNPSSIDVLNDSIMVMGGVNYKFIMHVTVQVPITAFSTDSGASWRVKDFSPNDIYGVANNIKLLDENTAITTLKSSALNDYASGVLYTTNKGVTWSKGAGIVDQFNYSDMKIINRKVYVGGTGSVFLASGNEPADPWELRFESEFQKPVAAAFLNSGYSVMGSSSASSKPSKIYISTDKGNQWVVKSVPWQYLKDIAISGDSVLFMLASGGLYRSDLSCSTISLVSSLLLWNDLEVLPNGDLWACYDRELIFSNNSGKTWQTKFTSTSGSFWKIRMFSDGSGFANDGSLYKTTDFGNTWTKLGFSQYILTGFDFSDRNNGLIFHSYNKVHRTTDGGISFHPLTFEGNSSIHDVFCLDSLNLFVCGDNVFSTYDGGWIWKKNQFQGLTAGPGSVNGLFMFDYLEGIFIGGTKGVWKTFNRGNTPVELSLFSAVSLGNKVALQWTTETETNNMGFEIERRYKHGDWEKIAFSKGSGTSTRKIYYGYDDYEIKAPAILYYRLKQIDYNGEFHYSKEVEVIYGETPQNYSIQQNFPNPFNPSTKVTFSLPEENEVVIRVFNSMGEQVKEINRGILPHGYFEQEFEMRTESSGMYFCQILCTNTISGRTKSLTIKMVLMK